MQTWLKRTGITVVVAVIGLGFYEAIRERPISVDLAIVERADMRVSIKEEGQTRVQDIYSLSAPIAGHLDRIILDEGQAVLANTTVVASIHPLDPPFLDQRTEEELRSAVKAAQSAVALAKVEHNRAKMALQLNQSEYDRAAELAKKKVLPLSQLEKAFNALELQKAQVESAKAAINLRVAELESVRARQRQPQTTSTSPSGQDCCIQLLAPVDGVVLKVMARSEQAVSPGSVIAEIGNPRNLEVIVDLLSADAAKVKPGTEVRMTDWGGDTVLIGTVKRVDPAAFTKVSSLGIEEQRVNVVIDLPSPPESLGHGYRVLVDLVVWSQSDVLQVPIGALFRSSGQWATYVDDQGVARLTLIELGQMTDETAQVLQGLEDGQRVVLYPNDALTDGAMIEPR
ncbi:efflux RND transporter periplasmic adaptor subunit [Pseudahrensia aquimaris]|uniref:Efflux RND transporter periplasmic adaptor subunit n=1 Tax=Pseudahrensia aquimaris TaxID=744461 RepID=A0ABW3FAH2_9HYPH